MNWNAARRPNFSQALARWLRPLETIFSRLFGADYNPTYQSGVLAVFFLGLVLFSGVVLLFFYRVGAPYESVSGLQQQWWLGRWMRALHRYASDAAVLAVAVHVVRMLVGGRTWGPRTRAWVSGIAVTALMIFIGVTGLILVWDEQAQRLALAAIGYLDALPIFSEPPRRVFSDNSSVGQAFFFMLMFLHVAVPLMLTFGLWFHTSRVARARLWPEKHLQRFYGAGLLILSVLWPAALAAPADLLKIPGKAPLDLFYGFWLPLSESLGRGWTVWILLTFTVALAFVPVFCTPQKATGPSVVDESSCTGCTQCFQDCPYDAIQMVKRSHLPDERHSELVARVDPDLCVSCGICAGSCAPMGVGPAQRTGRDQLRQAEEFTSSITWKPGDIVVMACRWGCGEAAEWALLDGVHLFETGCSGSLHTSAMEFMLRKGASGVLIVSCPERDCSHREGPKWLRLRVFEDREAELQSRVDRRRVKILACPAVELPSALEEARRFRQEMLALGQGQTGDLEAIKCRGVEVEVA